jgi:hypothetical protein
MKGQGNSQDRYLGGDKSRSPLRSVPQSDKRLLNLVGNLPLVNDKKAL